MDQELKDLLKDSVNIEPFQSEDRRGDPSYGTAVAIPSRVVGRVEMVRDAEGVERVSKTQVYIDGELPTGLTALSEKDRITLPSGYSPSQPPILAIARPTDPESGEIDHYKVWTG